MEQPNEILRRVRMELTASQLHILQMLGVPESERMAMATEAVEALGQQAIERANKRTTENLLQGQGTQLLADEKNNPKNHAAFEKRRAEGVSNADIERWWNLSVVEQEIIMVEDEPNRMTFFTFLRGKGMSADEAATETFKRHARWGEPSSATGNDRPLYVELKFRVLEFVERLQANPQEMNERLANCSSLNALFREELRHGRA